MFAWSYNFFLTLLPYGIALAFGAVLCQKPVLSVRAWIAARRRKLRDKGIARADDSTKLLHTLCGTSVRIGIDAAHTRRVYCWRCEEVLRYGSDSPDDSPDPNPGDEEDTPEESDVEAGGKVIYLKHGNTAA